MYISDLNYFSVDEGAILDCVFEDFNHQSPSGFERIMIEKALLWSVINECIFLSLPVIATLTLLPTYNVFIYLGDKVSQMLSYVSYRKFYKINQKRLLKY